MIGKTMDNPGERAAAIRKRSYQRMIGVYVAVAVLILVGTWLFKRGDGEIAPAWAITFSLLYAGTLVVGGWLINRRSDEVERRDDLFAASLAARFYVLAFPVWYFLGKSHLTPQPDQLVLFGGF